MNASFILKISWVLISSEKTTHCWSLVQLLSPTKRNMKKIVLRQLPFTRGIHKKVSRQNLSFWFDFKLYVTAIAARFDDLSSKIIIFTIWQLYFYYFDDFWKLKIYIIIFTLVPKNHFKLCIRLTIVTIANRTIE